MKVSIFITTGYSLGYTFREGFIKSGWNAEIINFTNFFSAWEISIFERISGLPKLLKSKWYDYFIKRINEQYILYISKNKPDLILIFNHQFFSPESLTKVREKSKILFYLGDSPLLSQTYDLNLKILEYGDYIISPDSYWVEQLRIIGLKNVFFELISFNDKLFYPFKPTDDQIKQYKADITYLGVNYNNSSGYKKTLFLSKFARFDLKIYASGIKSWNKWLKYFPELKDSILRYDNYDQSFNNLIQNCSKLYPVDANHVVINGVHVRILDCIGSGILPLVEYRKDVEDVFRETGLPIIRNYNESAEIASYYLEKEDARNELVQNLRHYLIHTYPIESLISKIGKSLFNI